MQEIEAERRKSLSDNQRNQVSLLINYLTDNRILKFYCTDCGAFESAVYILSRLEAAGSVSEFLTWLTQGALAT
jgi:hypothetical protein